MAKTFSELHEELFYLEMAEILAPYRKADGLINLWKLTNDLDGDFSNWADTVIKVAAQHNIELRREWAEYEPEPRKTSVFGLVVSLISLVF